MNLFLKNDAHKVIGSLGDLNKRFSGKTILITGATGFLGSHFVHYFLQLNNSGFLNTPCMIIGYDIFVTHKPSWVNQLVNRDDFILTTKNIVRGLIREDVDFIIHAASIASPKYYRKYPIETMDVNVVGTRKMLEYFTTNPVESMLYLSTSEVYGNPSAENIPTTEQYWGHVNNLGPRACYDESKRYGETLCYNFWQSYNVPVKIARPFNVFGTGLNIEDGRVIPDFFRSIIRNRDIELFSDGKSTRTFCYITDAMEGFLRVLLSSFNGEVFNIGNDSPEISIIELAQIMKTACEGRNNIILAKSDDQDYNTDSPLRRCPSIEKAKNFLGYYPKISLLDGLALSFEYYKQHSK